MAKGKKTGGRGPGTPNREKQDLLGQLREAVGALTPGMFAREAALAGDPRKWHPCVQLSVAAVHGKLPGTSLEFRARCAMEVLKYIAPKLKSIEHSGALDVGVSGVLRVPTGSQSEEDWEG